MSDKKKGSNKVTTVLAQELLSEATELTERTGIGMADVLRQGLIRVLLEVRTKGSFETMPLPPRAV